MTTAPIPAAEPRPASNAPAPPRAFGPVATLIRRWLGIADQRQDFDALALTLVVKDTVVEGQGRDVAAVGKFVGQLARQLHETSELAYHVRERLGWHERGPLARSRKAYDVAVVREKARRDAYLAEHPGLPADVQAHYRATGQLPKEKAAPAAADAPAPPSAAEG